METLVRLRRQDTEEQEAISEFGAAERSLGKRLKVEPPMRVRFVRREPALASFGQFLTDPVGVLELHGHPGVGKTRLLGEFARGARRAGYRVLRAGADPSSRPPNLRLREQVRNRYCKTTSALPMHAPSLPEKANSMNAPSASCAAPQWAGAAPSAPRW